MKPAALWIGLVIAGLSSAGCHTHPASAAPADTTSASPIPDRPEQLVFPPLDYQPPHPDEFRVTLTNGPIAYVASDRELPLVNLLVLVRVGHYLDPQGQEGLADLTGYLLSKGGTKSMSAEDLEERLAFLAADFSSETGDTQGRVHLNLLSKDLDEGLALLREALTAPRFQEDKLTLRKEQLLQAMKQRNDDSANLEARERGFLAYGDSFWSNQYDTESSIAAISRPDLQAFHQQWFHPRNFVVAASGDFDRQELIGKLEAVFAHWPFPGQTPPAIPTHTTFAAPGIYLVDKDVTQGRVSVLLPGVMRTDPDYFPVVLMNRILGGGGFTSRLVNRVRSDEGLAYAAASTFPGSVYYPEPFVAGFQTKSRTVAYATSIVLQEIHRLAQEPVTAAELETAQRSMIDTFPRAFASKAATVERFATDEFTGRYHTEPDYYMKYRDRIAAVTIPDIQRAARTHLDARPPAILVVGDKEEILKGHPDHPGRLEDLVKGPMVAVPLRDPMTMRPLTE
ncbi:MAG: insulinase family protein [Verrucomicrobia bacterium]|jgi:zinc protease|nr:insulinase family protein [Verrucomicrobiota bacterium]